MLYPIFMMCRTIELQLLQRLSVSGATALFPTYAFGACTGITLYSTLQLHGFLIVQNCVITTYGLKYSKTLLVFTTISIASNSKNSYDVAYMKLYYSTNSSCKPNSTVCYNSLVTFTAKF